MLPTQVGQTVNSVRMPTLLHRLLIASRPQLMDTLQPPHNFTETKDLLFVISAQRCTLMCTQCILSHCVSPVFGVGVAIGLKGGQMSIPPTVTISSQSTVFFAILACEVHGNKFYEIVSLVSAFCQRHSLFANATQLCWWEMALFLSPVRWSGTPCLICSRSICRVSSLNVLCRT